MLEAYRLDTNHGKLWESLPGALQNSHGKLGRLIGVT